MAVLVPDSLDEALAFLEQHRDALVLAGGTDVMVDVNGGRTRPSDVVCVHRIRELRSWTADQRAGTLHLGAAVTYAEIQQEPIAGFVPALAEAARTVGSPQIRHAATIGGNVGTASPAGDGLPVLAALDAVVHLASRRGTRDVPFAEFAIGPKRTVRQLDELITGVTVPIRRGFQGYRKVGVRNAMVIATTSACLVADAADGSVRLALGSVGPVIIRAAEAERLAGDVRRLRGATELLEACVAAAQAAARPIDDHRSSAAYRRHAVGVLTRRLLEQAVATMEAA